MKGFLLFISLVAISTAACASAQAVCASVGFDSACGNSDDNSTCGITCNGTHCVGAVNCIELGMSCQAKICVQVTAIVAVSQPSPAPLASGGCNLDSDCPVNQTCFNGTCSIVIGGTGAQVVQPASPVAAPVAVVPCTSNNDCAVGSQVCRQGACVPFLSCSNDLQCSDGLICQNGGCTTPILCTTSSQCPSSHICNAGRCVVLINAGFPVLGGGAQTTTVVTQPTNSANSVLGSSLIVLGAAVMLAFL